MTNEHNIHSRLDAFKRAKLQMWWTRSRILNNKTLRVDGVGECGVDWDYWMQRMTWSLEEAACLAAGVCPFFYRGPPPVISEDSGELHVHTVEGALVVQRVFRVLREVATDLSDASPLQWAKRLLVADQEIPPQIERLLADKSKGGGAPVVVKKKGSASVRERQENLQALISGVLHDANEKGCLIIKDQWPGTKREFREFVQWKDSSLSYRLPVDDKALSKELALFGVKFCLGAKRSCEKGRSAYRRVYPEYAG